MGFVHYALQLTEALEARGHRVRTVGFRRIYPRLLYPGRCQTEGPAPPAGWDRDAPLDTLSPASWRLAGELAAAHAPEVVLLQHWMPLLAPALGVAAARAKRLGGARVVTIVHNALPHEYQPAARTVTRWFLGQSDGLIVHARAVEAQLRSFAPGMVCRVTPHPAHGIFRSRLASGEARALLGLPAGNPLLLFFGHVRRYKGLEVLLRALPAVRERLPGARLVVAGEFYLARRPFEALVASLGLGEAVLLLDRFIPTDQVGHLFAAADLVVLPYLAASQSGVVAVAAVHGKPVVATTVGGLDEQVTDGVTGFLVPPGDPAALAGGILRWSSLADPGAMERAIRQRGEEWSWDTLARVVEELA
jgi:glycosyltransferase involved in cell wall biosynthesis